jgi:hypothetical protein
MAQLERVREALHQQPFRAFEIRLLDGRMLTVKHPDFVALPPPPQKRDIIVWDWALRHRFTQPGTHKPLCDYTYAEQAPDDESGP